MGVEERAKRENVKRLRRLEREASHAKWNCRHSRDSEGVVERQVGGRRTEKERVESWRAARCQRRLWRDENVRNTTLADGTTGLAFLLTFFAAGGTEARRAFPPVLRTPSSRHSGQRLSRAAGAPAPSSKRCLPVCLRPQKCYVLSFSFGSLAACARSRNRACLCSSRASSLCHVCCSSRARSTCSNCKLFRLHRSAQPTEFGMKEV